MYYLQVDRNDLWTTSNGSVPNGHRRCAVGACPTAWGGGERLINHPGVYNYGVFIGYNASLPFGTGARRGSGRPSART